MKSQLSIRTARRVGAATCAVLLTGLVGCAGMDDEISDESLAVKGGINPIVFVPPCPPPGVDYALVSTAYNPLIELFLENGYPESFLNNWVPNVGLPVCYGTNELAQGLSDYVDQVLDATNRPRVDIIGASGGALTARLYVAEYGGRHNVRNLVSVAGPNHGTEFGINGGPLQDAFGAPSYEQLKETYPPYACEGQTYFGQSEDVQFVLNGCLTPTGRTVNRDETPNGGVKYLSIRNTLDDQIFPNGSACLNQKFQNDCSDSKVNVAITAPAGPCPWPEVGGLCPAHVNTLFAPETEEMLWDFVTRRNDDPPHDPGDDNDD